MPEQERNVALLSSLRALVRGLSALFWGLPATLVIAVQTGKGEWLKPLGFTPILLAMGLLLYGVVMLGKFQTQERIWMSALERARFVAVLNLGLSPFLFFWSKMPNRPFFIVSVIVMIMSLLAFLYLLNSVLARLAAMLPDETLRGETRIFTRMNQVTLLVLLGSAPFYFIYFIVRSANTLPRIVVDVMLFFERQGGLLPLLIGLLFVLLPLAMTMALLWKTKEVIMNSVFSTAGGEVPAPGAHQ